MAFKEYEAVGESSLYEGSGPVKAVLSRIAYLIRDKRPTDTCPLGWSNVGEAYLAKWTGYSERTVRAAIQTLVKDEIVFRQTYRISGGFRKNRYALNMEAIKAALRPEFNPDVEEPQVGETYGDVDSDSLQAGETYSHRRNRPVPQAGETEATGGSRLKAVGFSSWGKQVDSAVTRADQRDTLRSDQGDPGPQTPTVWQVDEDFEPLPAVQPSAPQARVIPPPAPRCRACKSVLKSGQKIATGRCEACQEKARKEQEKLDAQRAELRRVMGTHTWDRRYTCMNCQVHQDDIHYGTAGECPGAQVKSAAAGAEDIELPQSKAFELED